MIDGPYPGLNPFREEDSSFFFGRDTERELIAANLTASRLTLLYGPSGVGKSSLLNAGVIAQLRQTARQSSISDLPSVAVVAFQDWRNDPLKGLFSALRDQAGEQGTDGTLRECLRKGSTHRNRDMYVILDQFEEYFLYQSANDSAGGFARELAAAINAPEIRVNFLVSIREDALAKLDLFKGRIANLFDNYLRVSHLSHDAARSAIENPISRFNALRHSRAPAVTVEEELVEEILDQLAAGQADWEVVGKGSLRSAPDSTLVEAPYLQLVLRRLWQEEMRVGSNALRLKTLTGLGGPWEIVKKHLDDVLRGFDAQERGLAASLFHYLVTPSGAKIAHTVTDLAAYVGSSGDAVKSVVGKLAASATRILREVPSLRPSGDMRYEIFHDALAPAVLDWRRRQQDDQLRQSQRIAVSALQDAITSGLGNRNPEEMTRYVLEQVGKVSSESGTSLSPGTLSGRSLLWVDDRPTNNLYEAGLLERAGVKITTAVSTEEAKLRLESSRFDLVISDIHRTERGVDRPGAGYDLLQWVRKRKCRVPLIFYIGDVNRVDSKLSTGAVGIADKPGTLIDLVVVAIRQEDIQKGRWGGRSLRNYRRLTAAVKKTGPGRFNVDLWVREARDEPPQPGDTDPGPLQGVVEFHLHQTFANPVLKRTVKGGVAHCDLSVYGAFTVGVVADAGQTHLELDLALDESFPKEFREN